MKSLHTAALRLWVVRYAVGSLLLMQSLGVLHSAAHGAARTALSSVAHATAHADTLNGHVAGHVASIFAGHHAGDTGCQLFDQLSHVDLASLPTLTTPVSFSTTPAHARASPGHLPAPTRSYSARGPPALA